MILLIKNMVCRHCAQTVERTLRSLGLDVRSVELGAAEISDDPDEKTLRLIASALEDEGFELIQSREAATVEAIKHRLIELSRTDGEQRRNISEVLEGISGMGYTALSRLFSQIEGRSIENYFMSLRIERVKELIKYRKLTLSEIAWLTGYSSVAHLSAQFKRQTGLTPTQFRDLGTRKPLPEV